MDGGDLPTLPYGHPSEEGIFSGEASTIGQLKFVFKGRDLLSLGMMFCISNPTKIRVGAIHTLIQQCLDNDRIDNSPAEDDISVVPDRRLTWGNPKLRIVKH